jgi:hypothetical protein
MVGQHAGLICVSIRLKVGQHARIICVSIKEKNSAL